MTIKRRLPRTLVHTLIGITLLAPIAGCQQYWRDSGLWDVGEHKGLLLDISQYYNRHATEEDGYCKSPILDGITRADVIEENDEKVWVSIRYAYRDFLKDDDDCDSNFRPLRCSILRECRGYASRTFEAVKTETGFEVTEMAGPRRR